jgi:hypothetical protein
METSDRIRNELSSIGIAFYEPETPIVDADPEKAFLNSISEWQSDRKILKLLISWMDEFGDLFHIERLKALAKSLPANEIAWLGGFAKHRLSAKDYRWVCIEKFCTSKLGAQSLTFSTTKLDLLQAKRNGKDENFSQFGILIPKVEPADKKKLLPRSEVLRRHQWLRLRLVFGANFRADMAHLILKDIVPNAFQAERLLGCNRQTAYKLWGTFHEVRISEVIKAV